MKKTTKRKGKKYGTGFTAVTVAAILPFFGGCGAASSGGASGVTMSGTLAAASGGGSRMIKRLATGIDLNESLKSLFHADSIQKSVSYTGMSVYCATITVPPVAFSSTVASDGSFSVDISNGVNQPMSCELIDASGNSKGTFLVSDSSHKDMGGNASVSSTVAFATSAALGSISYDADAGEITIPAAQIAGSLASLSANAQVFDPTGSWTISAVDFTLPKGVSALCQGHGDNCNGPSDGDGVYMQLFQGKAVSDASAVYAFTLWNSSSAADSCGIGGTHVVGLSSADQSAIGVDFSALGTASAAFQFPTSVVVSNGDASSSNNTLTAANSSIANGYQLTSAALSPYSMQACDSETVTIAGQSYNAYKCGAGKMGYYSGTGGSMTDVGSAEYYQINVSGCVDDVTGAAVQPGPSDWSGQHCGTDAGHTNFNSTPIGDTGYTQMVCGLTLGSSGESGHTATCTNMSGAFDVSGNPAPTSDGSGDNLSFDYSTIPSYLSQGALCSTGDTSTTAGQVAQELCYAQAFQNFQQNDQSYCLPKINQNWAATSPADAVELDFRPGQLIFENQYVPNPDGSGGSILTRQEQYDGVQIYVGSNQEFVNCHTITTGGLSFTKVTDNKLLATYVASEVTTDLDVPACASAFNGKKQTFIFYVTK